MKINEYKQRFEPLCNPAQPQYYILIGPGSASHKRFGWTRSNITFIYTEEELMIYQLSSRVPLNCRKTRILSHSIGSSNACRSKLCIANRCMDNGSKQGKRYYWYTGTLWPVIHIQYIAAKPTEVKRKLKAMMWIKDIRIFCGDW
jgi:hypothetical protein